MKKLKLNIQYFASTNSTTHYNLSQYIATDKPTYLVDYNGDMLKIDTAIYNAMSKASVNEANIGTMSNLNTSEKTSLVGAINEVNTQVESNTSNIEQNTQDISANNTKIGTLADLSTIYKTNLVGAINEVKSESNDNKANIEKFNLNNYTEYSTANSNINITAGSIESGSLKVATNSDGSIGKIYGSLYLDLHNDDNPLTISIQTSLRPKTNITINSLGINFVKAADTFDTYPVDVKINTNGLVTFELLNAYFVYNERITLFPSLLFMDDFGDGGTE